MILLLACTDGGPTTGRDDFLAEVDFVVERGGIGPEEVSLDLGSIVAFDGEDRSLWAARTDDGSSELVLVVEGESEVAQLRYRKGQQHIHSEHATCTVERAGEGTEIGFACTDLHTEEGLLAPEDHEPWSIRGGTFVGGALTTGPRAELLAAEGYSWSISVDGVGHEAALLAPWRAGEWWVWHADDGGVPDDVEFRVVPEAGRLEVQRLARDLVALETPVELHLTGTSSLSVDHEGLVHQGTDVDVLLWEDLVEGEDLTEVTID